jgi:hypothetical protein
MRTPRTPRDQRLDSERGEDLQPLLTTRDVPMHRCQDSLPHFALEQLLEHGKLRTEGMLHELAITLPNAAKDGLHLARMVRILSRASLGTRAGLRHGTIGP